MVLETIEVRKTTPIIGAASFGVDLAKPLTNRQFDEIRKALLENIARRDQDRLSRSSRPHHARTVSP
jgi:taurine dioxygenase